MTLKGTKNAPQRRLFEWRHGDGLSGTASGAVQWEQGERINALQALVTAAPVAAPKPTRTHTNIVADLRRLADELATLEN